MAGLVCKIELSKSGGITISVDDSTNNILQECTMDGTTITMRMKDAENESTIEQTASKIAITCKEFLIDAETITCNSTEDTLHTSKKKMTFTSTEDMAQTSEAKLSQTAPADIAVKTDANMTIDTGEKLTVTATGDISLSGENISATANSDATIESSNATITGSTKVAISGAEITAAADSEITLSGSIANLDGTTTNVSGTVNLG